MASVNFYYKDKQVKRSRIICQLSDGRNTRIKLSTGISANRNDWSFKNSKFKPSGGADKRREELNVILITFKDNVEVIYHQGKFNGDDINSAYIKRKLSELEKHTTKHKLNNGVFGSLEKYVTARTDKSKNFMRTAKPVIMHLSFFAKQQGFSLLKFSDLNKLFLDAYVHYLKNEECEFVWNGKLRKKRPLASGTVKRHLTHLKNLAKMCPSDVDVNNALFNYSVTEINSKESQRPLVWEELKEIMTYKPSNELEEYTKDIFLFTCFSGLRISAVQSLRPGDIKDGFICWINTKVKTNPMITTTIHRFNVDIIVKYKGLENSHLFPLLPQQKLNVTIKSIARKLKIENPDQLHNHTGRHTYNSLLYSLGLDTFIRNEELGHSHSTTNEKIYTKLDPKDRKRIVAEIWDSAEEIFSKSKEQSFTKYDEI